MYSPKRKLTLAFGKMARDPVLPASWEEEASLPEACFSPRPLRAPLDQCLPADMSFSWPLMVTPGLACGLSALLTDAGCFPKHTHSGRRFDGLSTLCQAHHTGQGLSSSQLKLCPGDRSSALIHIIMCHGGGEGALQSKKAYGQKRISDSSSVPESNPFLTTFS